MTGKVRGPEDLTLRDTLESDLEIFFNNQLDKEAGHMAAFTAKDPTDREAYFTKWKKLLQDDTKYNQTILWDELIVGSISSYAMAGELHVTYWISKQYWGKGIATNALLAFLKKMHKRPLFGSAAFDNLASQRVMEKCGFKFLQLEKGFANARDQEIEERIYCLAE